MGEESLWLAQNASIKEDEETSELRDSEDDDDIKNGDKLEGNSSSNCDFSNFKVKPFPQCLKMEVVITARKS